jgi:hypothetical protein
MWSDRKELIAAIEAKRKSRLICFLTSDRLNAAAIIAKDVLPVFFNQLRDIGDVKRLDLLVFTSGGDTLAAFGLARLLREFAKWVGVLVPDRCLSAGTLLALGANEIYMTRAGTLSPIDPSVTTPLNPVGAGQMIPGMMMGQQQPLPVSVESVAGFQSLIEEDWKITDQRMLTTVFKILADKVHPLALGDIYRSRQQIERLAHKLMTEHRRDKTQFQKAVRILTRGLGSHDYPIFRSEARELLGRQIGKDDPALESMVWDLFQDFSKEMQLGIPYNPASEIAKWKAADKPQPTKVNLKLAVVETAVTRDVFEQQTMVTETLVPSPAGPMKALQNELVEASWKRDQA